MKPADPTPVLIDQPALSHRARASTYVLARVALNGQAMPSTARGEPGTPPQESIAQAIKAMRLNADDFVLSRHKTVDIEIGGVHERRRSNRADSRSRLTFWPPAPTVSKMTWVGPVVGTQWSATPFDAPLAPSQVPSEKTTQHPERMAPGRL